MYTLVANYIAYFFRRHVFFFKGGPPQCHTACVNIVGLYDCVNQRVYVGVRAHTEFPPKHVSVISHLKLK